MPDPVTIAQAFEEMTRLIHEPVEGEASHPEAPAMAVDDRVAAKWGIPFEDLVYACIGEQEACFATLQSAGPARAFVVSQIAAFLAGVRWEQGRHSSEDVSPREQAAIDLLARLYNHESSEQLDEGMFEGWVEREIATFIREFGVLR